MCPDVWSNTYVPNREAERTEGEAPSHCASLSRAAQVWGIVQKACQTKEGLHTGRDFREHPSPTPLLAPPSSHPTTEDLSSVISAKELSLTFELWKFLQTDYAASESGTGQ